MVTQVIRSHTSSTLCSGIIGTLFVLMATACSSHSSPADQAAAQQAKIRQQVQAIVVEPARATQVLTLVAEWDKRTAAQQQTNSAFTARLDAVNADYAATPEAFTTLYAQRHASDVAFIHDAVQLRARLIELTTPAEWEKLKDVRAELRQPIESNIVAESVAP